LFYWAVNAGSLLSTFTSPYIRSSTCGVLGTGDSCYFIAFGIPTVMMILAVICLLLGKSYYTMKPPVGENIFIQVVKYYWYKMTKKNTNRI